MPIFDRDESTRKYADPGEIKFSVRCDCAGEGDCCAQLDHSLISWGEGEPDELYITLVPKFYPWGLVDRIKHAWYILTHGNLKYRDNMCLEAATIEGWAERLLEIARRMRAWRRDNLLEPLSTEGVAVSENPEKLSTTHD